nr:ethylene receptor 2-like [Physcomitrium patens]|eukprot:XP_024396407.1 ethylene receptor 2-like [Physcomitrella patens]
MLLATRIEARKYERLGKRFDAILKMMPQAVVFVDDEFGQVLINPAAASLLGLPNHGEVEPSRVAGTMKRLAASSGGQRTDPQKWYKAFTGVEEPQEIEEEWVLKPRRVLHVRSFPVSSSSAHGRLWLYEDVTTDRDACEAIEAANRAKSQLLAMMSHELRTPMTGVLGMVDLLHLTKLVPQQQELVKIMQELAEGLLQVINNILDFCKMEAGRLFLEEIDFSLSDLIEQVATLHEKIS